MAMGIAAQLGASLTGNIEQAYLVISDYRNSPGALGGGTSAKPSAPKMSQFRAMAQAASTFATAMPNTPTASTAVVPPVSQDKLFKVHFNPSAIQLYATSLPIKKTDIRGKEPIHDSVAKGKLTFGTTLFFDEMNVYDSFLWDKFTAGLTAQGVKNIAAAVLSAKGKTWSVQDEVEGLVAALRNPLTRNITFRWADFSFFGQLNNISVEYTMFSAAGRPVRAQVMLRLHHEMDDVRLASWYQDFDTAFGGSGSSLTGVGQKMGALLNVSL